MIGKSNLVYYNFLKPKPEAELGNKDRFDLNSKVWRHISIYNKRVNVSYYTVTV